jgi:hypothetical protein
MGTLRRYLPHHRLTNRGREKRESWIRVKNNSTMKG